MHDPVFHTLRPSVRIPFLSGRPRRGAVIDGDDLANLRIALGLHHDVLDLCEDGHLFAPRPGGASRAGSGRTQASTTPR